MREFLWWSVLKRSHLPVQGPWVQPLVWKAPRLSMILTICTKRSISITIQFLGRGAVATEFALYTVSTVYMCAIYTVYSVLLVAAVMIEAVQGQPVDTAACIFPRLSPLYVLRRQGKMNSKKTASALERTKTLSLYTQKFLNVEQMCN